MRVLQIIPSYPPTEITGPPAAIHRLCQQLQRLDVDVRTLTTNDSGSRSKLGIVPNCWNLHEGIPVFYGRRIGLRGDLSFALWRAIKREIPRSDVVHLTAVFSWPLVPAARACQRYKIPLVISPRGSLSPQAMAWRAFKKSLFMSVAGHRALLRASAFHVTSKIEEEDLKRLFHNPITCVVPNGVEVPEEGALSAWKSEEGRSSVLYLGRLHPQKNLRLLIEAWGIITRSHSLAKLIVAGPDQEGMRSELITMTKHLGIEGRVEFPGRVNGLQKNRLLATARVLVQPSKAENFGNVVAEALAHGTPVIASTGTPWKEVAAKGCGWWVPAERESLVTALTEALALEDNVLNSMGNIGRRWMQDQYSWPVVATKMLAFYERVVRSHGSKDQRT